MSYRFLVLVLRSIMIVLIQFIYFNSIFVLLLSNHHQVSLYSEVGFYVPFFIQQLPIQYHLFLSQDLSSLLKFFHPQLQQPDVPLTIFDILHYIIILVIFKTPKLVCLYEINNFCKLTYQLISHHTNQPLSLCIGTDLMLP